MTNRIHAHVTTRSADCDGSYSDDYVTEINDDEAKSEFADLEFKERVLGGRVSFHGHVEVEVTPNGFTSNEKTEEGFRWSRVVWCEDDCDFTKRNYRDHRAESMGY